MNMIKHFVVWVDVPVEEVTYATVSRYIDYLMKKRRAPKTVNCNLDGIRQFYHYLKEEEGMPSSTQSERIICKRCPDLFLGI